MKDILTYNFILDLKKLDIDEYDRAELIYSFMKSNKLSLGTLSKRVSVSQTKLSNWLVWLKISKEQYKTMIGNGLSKDDIKKIIKSKKDEPISEDYLQYTAYDMALEKAILDLRRFILKPGCSKYTKELMQECKNVLNRAELHMK